MKLLIVMLLALSVLFSAPYILPKSQRDEVVLNPSGREVIFMDGVVLPGQVVSLEILGTGDVNVSLEIISGIRSYTIKESTLQEFTILTFTADHDGRIKVTLYSQDTEKIIITYSLVISGIPLYNMALIFVSVILLALSLISPNERVTITELTPSNSPIRRNVFIESMRYYLSSLFIPGMVIPLLILVNLPQRGVVIPTFDGELLSTLRYLTRYILLYSAFSLPILTLPWVLDEHHNNLLHDAILPVPFTVKLISKLAAILLPLLIPPVTVLVLKLLLAESVGVVLLLTSLLTSLFVCVSVVLAYLMVFEFLTSLVARTGLAVVFLYLNTANFGPLAYVFGIPPLEYASNLRGEGYVDYSYSPLLVARIIILSTLWIAVTLGILVTPVGRKHL